MENLVFKIVQDLMKFVVAMIVTGTFVSVCVDLQRMAFQNKKIGLVSMSKINQQLVGKTK